MIRIAVTDTGTPHKQENYLRWLKEWPGVDAITVSADDQYRDQWTRFHGLLLSGGVDISPTLTGVPGNYPNAPEQFNEVRDLFEREIYGWARERGVPILGICRGMQLINVLNGGSLLPDLGAEGNTVHRAVPEDKRHFIRVEAGSVFEGLSQSSELEVNSAHHQALARAAGGFRFGCYSEEGIPESLEPLDPGSFILGVQWHPERMYQKGLEQTPAATQVRKLFLEAAAACQRGV